MALISGEGALRSAASAIATNGGSDVLLRLPGAAVSGSDAEQMGLASPQFEDLPLGKAVWRRTGITGSLLVDGNGVHALAGLQGASSATELFESAVGVVVTEICFVIKNCEAVLVNGTPCAYRLTVEEPTWK